MTQVAIEFASETAMHEVYAREAVERFYAAVNRMLTGDPKPLTEIWDQTPEAVEMSPFGGRQVGWPQVERHLRDIADLKMGGKVTPKDLLVRVEGDWAYCVCIERAEDLSAGGKPITLEHRATLVLRRYDKDWRVIYHHSDPEPALLEALGPEPPPFETPPLPNAEYARDLLNACERFYEAVNAMFAGDLLPMSDAWCHTEDVTLLGPCGNVYVGWEAVRAEFERHSKQRATGRIRFRDPYIRIEGDVAYASCIEYGDNLTIDGKPVTMNQRATSIFVREDNQWRMVHHQGDHVPGMDEPLAKPRT